MSERVPGRRPASVDRWEPMRELEQATERMQRMLDPTRVDADTIDAKLADGVGRGRTLGGCGSAHA